MAILKVDIVENLIKEMLYLQLFKMQIRILMVVTITMTVMLNAIMDFNIPLCSSLAGGNESSVKIDDLVWCGLSCRLEEFHRVSPVLHR